MRACVLTVRLLVCEVHLTPTEATDVQPRLAPYFPHSLPPLKINQLLRASPFFLLLRALFRHPEASVSEYRKPRSLFRVLLFAIYPRVLS